MSNPFPQIPSRFSSRSDPKATPDPEQSWPAPPAQPWQPHPAYRQLDPQPSHAQRPRARFADLPRTQKATAILWWVSATWLALAPGIWLLGSLLSISSFQGGIFGFLRLVRLFGNVSDTDSLGEVSAGLIVATVATLLVLAAATLAAYGIVIHFAVHQQARGARVLATVLTGFGLLGLFGGPFSALWVFITVSGTICAWLPRRVPITPQARKMVAHMDTGVQLSSQIAARGIEALKSPEVKAGVAARASELRARAERFTGRGQHHRESVREQHDSPSSPQNAAPRDFSRNPVDHEQNLTG